jgi:site-specific recombinase XerD
MYKYGNTDIRALQEILGHESVATTQIYTHIDSEVKRVAANSHPLANIL